MAGTTGNDQDVVSQDAGSVGGFYLGYDPGYGTVEVHPARGGQNDPPDLGHRGRPELARRAAPGRS